MLEEHVLQFRQLGIRDTLDAMTALLLRRENGESFLFNQWKNPDG